MIRLFFILFAFIFIVCSIFSFLDGNYLQCLVLFACNIIGIIPIFIINNKKKTLEFKLHNIIITIFIIFGIIGVITYIKNTSLPNKASVIAEVVNLYETSNSSYENPSYYPEVKYVVNEETYYKKIKSVFGNYSIGQKVELSYNTQNPTQANMKLSPIILLCFSAFLCTGLVLLIFRRKKYPKQKK